MMMTGGEVIHAVPGRLRVRIARSLIVSHKNLALLLAAVEGCPTVHGARYNPASRSLLVMHAESADASGLLAHLRTEAGIRLDFAPKAWDFSVTQTATASFKVLDRRFRMASGGWVDSHSVLFVTFLSLAIMQLRRGHLMGPALTLFLQAIGFLKR
ncbi:MAG: hypothetical protein RIQ52_251 [Pseudomonadota bacterium]|jgi:hypothetical protein